MVVREAGVAELIAQPKGAELLDAAIAHAGVALALVNGLIPACEVIGGKNAQAGEESSIYVGDVAIAGEEGLGERFGGVRADEVADVGA